MLIVGLTGSIGMGKSTAAAHLRARGLPVFDADGEVHRLYAGGKAVEPVERAFPGTTKNGGVDRAKLSAALVAARIAFASSKQLCIRWCATPSVRSCASTPQHGAAIAVMEIPLLFETGADALVDATIVVSAPPEVQRARLLQRPGLSEAKLDQLLARQIPDAEKRARPISLWTPAATTRAARPRSTP